MRKILILGAGFGGLRVALKLGRMIERSGLKNRYHIFLVDRNDHHTYTPLLYEVATTSKDTANISKLHEIATYKIDPIIKGLPVTFIKAWVQKLDVVDAHIHLKDGRKLAYDYLVIALGSETNYFDIPGLKEHAFPLKTFQDAVRVRETIWDLALTETKDIRVVIGGGGPTGVELASELKVWCGELEKTFKRCRLEVTIIQGNKTILAGFAPKLIAKVLRRLARLGIQIITEERIVRAEKNKAVLRSGREISCDLLVWAGGVRAAETVSQLPLQCEEKGRIEVAGPMECLPATPNLKLHSKVYALGDAVCFYDPLTKKSVPGVARAAISQGTVVARNIFEDIKKDEGLVREVHHREYHPMEYPYIVPVGGKFAVAKIGPFIINGFFGWVLKGLVELNYLTSIMPIGRALRIWFTGLKTFIQNDRLG